ncbi:MAG: ABC transporter permease subunit [Candidatus Heimdallarchaeota archaeon]|nr:ABC transporter permease subunit [Candidatus Heimdallarchaeota archaeon]MCK4955888.1 ABC transporter permease subunit [Candidatus Heimdallarchaeota archaeon]
MNWNRIWALVRKDIAEFVKSKYVLSAVIGMPLLFAIIFPLTAVLPIAQIDPSEFESEEFGGFIDNLFSNQVDNWDTLGAHAQTLIIMAYAMFVMVLMLPIIIPAVTASETIVGEKERKTMVAILASPMSESEIVLAKIISSLLPSSIGTILAAVGYAVITDILIYPFIGQLLFPDLLSVIFVLIFSPMFSIISVELMIMISTRVTSVRDAYQLGSLIVLPLIFLIAAEMFGFFFNTYATLAGGLVLMLVIIAALFKLATSVFDREKAIVKMV